MFSFILVVLNIAGYVLARFLMRRNRSFGKGTVVVIGCWLLINGLSFTALFNGVGERVGSMEILGLVFITPIANFFLLLFAVLPGSRKKSTWHNKLSIGEQDRRNLK